MPPGARANHSKPVEGCAACAGVRVCPYHSARNSEELTRRFGEDLSREGCKAVADFYSAGFAALELLPVAALSQIAQDLDTRGLEKEMAKLSRKPELGSDDFRRLAAVALALATALDVRDTFEASNDDEEEDDQ